MFDRHAPAIYRFAAHRVGRGPAEDVLAETFTRAFAARRRVYTTQGSLRAWLYAIASNLIADELRRQERASAAHQRLRAQTPAQFAPDRGWRPTRSFSRRSRACARRSARRSCCSPGAADGERRAPSSAAAAATIQLFSSPPPRKPGRDGEPFVEASAPDPVSDVERLLAAGGFRDQGVSVRDGRRVRVLTAGWTRGGFETTTVEYVVDAETFAPMADDRADQEPAG